VNTERNTTRCIEHIIRDGSDWNGEKEWRVYISYEHGKKLFSPEDLCGESFPHPHSSWYHNPTNCWAFQWNDLGQEHDYWWTMDEELARKEIERHGWEVVEK